MTKSHLLLSAILVLGSLSLKAETAGDVYTKVDENPVPVRTVAPKATGESGLVAVMCVIDETGKVVSATVSKSTNASLDDSALNAIQNWSFKPAKKDGKAVKVRVTVPVRFEA